MIFADTLSQLADRQTTSEHDAHLQSFLNVYEQRLWLGFLPLRRRYGQLSLHLVNDEWRVMLTTAKNPEGPFYGADFSAFQGATAESALLGVWIRESDQWRRCISTEIEVVSKRIAYAVELAQPQ